MLLCVSPVSGQGQKISKDFQALVVSVAKILTQTVLLQLCRIFLSVWGFCLFVGSTACLQFLEGL